MADYKDKQEQVTTNGVVCGNAASATCTFSLNAAEVSISGLEIESRYYANENLSLNTAIGILDADYDSYDDGGVDISNIAKLRMAPEFTFNFGFDYDVNLAGGDLTFSGSYSGRDEYWGQANWKTYNFTDGTKVLVDSYESLDLSATFRAETSNGNQIRVTVFGNDILEEGGRIARPFDAGAFGFAAPAKRQHFGMKIGYEF
jgi:iron complex outermembrane receptor protein